jgi:hypothetical protein
MFARLSYTWGIMSASWEVLKRDKTLIFFPLLSCAACLLVIASFTVPALAYFPAWKEAMAPGGHLTPEQRIIGWSYLFAFYFVCYFVITFFNVGIISCAAWRIAGEETTFAGGMRAAFQRIHLIAGWALVSATVGVILKVISSHKRIGAIVSRILGVAWTIATFLVVPVLVVENKGPIDALKESTALLKKTWGMQLVGNFSFGLLFLLLLIPGFAMVPLSAYLTREISGSVGIAVLGLGVLYLIVLALIQSALHSIFQAALYMYTQGVTDTTGAFSADMLGGAMGGNY